MGETVLVTGGTGFVASWCVVELLKRGYSVRATLRSLSRADAVRAAVATATDPGDRLSFVVADLTSDAGWDEAVAGCAYVLHVASPLGGEGVEDLETLVAPARDGTVRVLRAAKAAGVRRVVVTSSCAAATPPRQDDDTVSDETTWTDPADPNLNAYRRSKAIAERAAWDWMARHDDPARLTTILPAAVFGPALGEARSSLGLIDGLLKGRPPGLPRVSFNVIDVRDLADLHIRAMTAPEAAGQRFIASGEFLWMKDVAAILRTRLGTAARRVPRRVMPDGLVRLLAVFVPPLRALTPIIGRRHGFSGEKARRVLDFQPRPVADTIADCGASLLA